MLLNCDLGPDCVHVNAIVRTSSQRDMQQNIFASLQNAAESVFISQSGLAHAVCALQAGPGPLANLAGVPRVIKVDSQQAR